VDDATAEGLTRGQVQALDELRAVSAADPRALEVVQVSPRTGDGWLPIEISAAAARPVGANPPLLATGPRATMRARERFIVRVPPQFPFLRPEVDVTHTRFAGLPHVQWQHRICLYLSPSTEWHPADGMFGLLERLLSWIDQAAVGALDPAGAPLHPPVAYATRDGGAAIIRADTPRGIALPWVGFAVFKQAQGRPIELVAWLDVEGSARLLAAPTVELLEELTGFNAGKKPLRLGVAVLLAEPTPFELPTQGDDVLNLLAERGVSREHLLDALAQVSFLNHRISLVDRASRQTLYLVLGTPGRGVAGGDLRQHLTVWRLPACAPLAASELEQAASLAHAAPSVHTRVRNAVSDWLAASRVDWAQVYELRPEVTVRRDRGSPLEWARGRTIAIIGCGALGGHIAEHFARAGAACLKLFDNGTVSPGVLVRQPYGHADVGTAKVSALCAHLHWVRSDLTLSSNSADALPAILSDTGWPPEVDLIVDAAANPAITAALERQRRLHADTTPPILSLLIGHTAHRGVATLAPRGYSGGGADLLRKAKMSMLRATDLRPFADDFFPDPPRATHFQPEPGCSEATFTGSHAEVAALAATLLTHTLAILAAPSPGGPDGHAVLVDLGLDSTAPMLRRLSWPKDVTVRDEAEDLDVRFTPAALAEVRAECRLMARRRSWCTETGGVLLGELDEACAVAWITSASGPPPDSRASEHLFVCGVEGVDELVQRHSARTRGAARFVGLWHSHPGGQAAPSPIDDAGIGEVVAPTTHAPRTALLVIVGAAKSTWTAWLDEEKEAVGPLPELYTQLVRRAHVGNRPMQSASDLYAKALASADQRETRRWPPGGEKGSARRAWWRRWRRWSRDA
jgi:proteasome lid subunit RPN8/RPN11